MRGRIVKAYYSCPILSRLLKLIIVVNHRKNWFSLQFNHHMSQLMSKLTSFSHSYSLSLLAACSPHLDS